MDTQERYTLSFKTYSDICVTCVLQLKKTLTIKDIDIYFEQNHLS